jgi:hypothetical protein
MTATVRTRMVGSVIFLGLFVLLAQAVSAATVTKLRVTGDTLTALFDANDPANPCLEHFVFVSASDRIQKVSPGDSTPDVGIVVEVIQQNICTGVPLFIGEGTTEHPNIDIAPQLKSATLTATLPVFDTVFTQSVSFTVHLVWTATGKPEKVNAKETFRDRELGIMIKNDTHSTQVPAIATGTVFGNGQNFTPEASDTATIAKQNDSSLTIEKTP